MGLFDFIKQKSQTPAAPQPRQDTKQGDPLPQYSPQPQTPKPQTESWKLVFTLSSNDIEKRELFLKELVRRANYVWHHLQGRAGMHYDKVRIHIEVKGAHDDIGHLVAWCKTTVQYGVHAVTIVKTPIAHMQYTGIFKRYDGPWAH